MVGFFVSEYSLTGYDILLLKGVKYYGKYRITKTFSCSKLCD